MTSCGSEEAVGDQKGGRRQLQRRALVCSIAAPIASTPHRAGSQRLLKGLDERLQAGIRHRVPSLPALPQ